MLCLLTNLIDQRKLMFWRKLRFTDNVVLIILSLSKRNAFTAVGSKYDINSYVRPTMIRCIRGDMIETCWGQH